MNCSTYSCARMDKFCILSSSVNHNNMHTHKFIHKNMHTSRLNNLPQFFLRSLCGISLVSHDRIAKKIQAENSIHTKINGKQFDLCTSRVSTYITG